MATRSATHSEAAGDTPASGTKNKRIRRSVTSDELMGDANELIIHHAGEEYRLTITKQAKLILTK